MQLTSLTFVCDEKYLCGDNEHNATNMSTLEIEKKQKVLENKAKNVLKCLRSMLKDTLRINWRDDANEVTAGIANTHSKHAFQRTMQAFLQEKLPSDDADLMLKFLKNTRKPHGASSKKWAKKTKHHMTLRKITDDEERHSEKKKQSKK